MIVTTYETSRSAIGIIDMANDFVTGSLANDRARRIIPNIKRLTDAARMYGTPVIYLTDAHSPNDLEFRKWPPHAIKGTWGAGIIDELAPAKGDYVIEKTTYSAFFETGLDTMLKDLGVGRVIITGQHTNICDRHTAADAFFRGYKIAIVPDATEISAVVFPNKDPEKVQQDAIEYIQTIYGAEVKTVDEIIAEMKKPKI